MRHQSILSVLVVVGMIFGAIGCTTQSKAAEEDGRRREWGEQFALDIAYRYLPLREDEQMLAEQGVLLSRYEQVEDMTLLDAFWNEYQAGDQTSLTVAVIHESFVLIRIVLSEGDGYYYRYEYLEDEPVSVTAKAVDRLEHRYDALLNKELLTLYNGKGAVAEFTFRPAADTGQQAA